MIILKKAEWTIWRLIGILLYYISLTSLFGWYHNIDNSHDTLQIFGFFDLFASFQKIMGTASTLIFLVVLFFSSLYLTLRISYRHILGHIQKTVPSITTIKETFLPGENITDIIPKNPKTSQEHAEKVAKLEEKIAELQAKKTPVISEKKQGEKIEPKGRKMLENMFSKGKDEQKIPLHDKNGEMIEQKPQKPNNTSTAGMFGKWEFPSMNLLNDIKHQNSVTREEVEEKSLIIQRTFLQFGIDVTMKDECIGPTVIQYRLEPSE